VPTSLQVDYGVRADCVERVSASGLPFLISALPGLGRVLTNYSQPSGEGNLQLSCAKEFEGASM